MSGAALAALGAGARGLSALRDAALDAASSAMGTDRTTPGELPSTAPLWRSRRSLEVWTRQHGIVLLEETRSNWIWRLHDS